MKNKNLHRFFLQLTYPKNLFLLFISFVIFSCQNDVGWDLKNEPLPTPTYLEFNDAQEFADYIIDPLSFEIPRDFVPLSKIINEKKIVFSQFGDTDLIKGYFIHDNGKTHLDFKYFGVSKALNKDHLVSIGGQLIKFDFDGQKISKDNSLEDLVHNHDLTMLNDRSFKLPLQVIETRSRCVDVYADFTDVYGLFVGAICAIVTYGDTSAYKMTEGSFTCDGGWVGVSLFDKTDFGSKSYGVSGPMWSRGLASFSPTCSQTYLQIVFDNARFQTAVVHTSAPLNAVCSIDINPTGYGSAIDPCP